MDCPSSFYWKQSWNCEGSIGQMQWQLLQIWKWLHKQMLDQRYCKNELVWLQQNWIHKSTDSHLNCLHCASRQGSKYHQWKINIKVPYYTKSTFACIFNLNMCPWCGQRPSSSLFFSFSKCVCKHTVRICLYSWRQEWICLAYPPAL